MDKDDFNKWKASRSSALPNPTDLDAWVAATAAARERWTTPAALVLDDAMQLRLAEIERLRAAALGVVSHMEGRRPERGWLKDNSKSRDALAELVRAIGA